MSKQATTIYPASKSLHEVYAKLKRNREMQAMTVAAVVQARADAKNGPHGISPVGGGKNRTNGAMKSTSGTSSSSSPSSSALPLHAPYPNQKAVNRDPIVAHLDGTMEYNCTSELHGKNTIELILKEAGMVRFIDSNIY
jgi:hypothetical protein